MAGEERAWPAQAMVFLCSTSSQDERVNTWLLVKGASSMGETDVLALFLAAEQEALKPRETSMINARYGIGSSPVPVSVQMLAQREQCTPERIRQILRKALLKIWRLALIQ